MRIMESELGKYHEREGRMFKVVCRDDIFCTERNFKYKQDLKRYIDKASVTNILIYVIDDMEACV